VNTTGSQSNDVNTTGSQSNDDKVTGDDRYRPEGLSIVTNTNLVAEFSLPPSRKGKFLML